MLVRFAPSPTGNLHVGNARIALVNFLLAGGQAANMVLRFDDTDAERSSEAFVRSIKADLHWLGLLWGEEVYQSQRLELYRAAADKLIAMGRLYPCYETPDELEYMRNRQRAKGLPPIYDRAALRLDEDARKALEAEGRRPHWRFKLEPGTLGFDDMVRGPCAYDAANLSDPVLIRGDGTFLYMLPSTVDDIDIGITHVVRGEDHVTNTAVQMQLFQALGEAPPTFAHLPLLVDAEGKGLSKRLGSLALGELRDRGIEPMAVNSLLARLGSSEAIEPVGNLSALVADFDIAHVSRATPRFDPAELDRLNQKLLHVMPWAVAGPRLHEMGLDHADAAFWDAVRGNLATITEASSWYGVVHGPMEPVVESDDDRLFLAIAADYLPDEPWDATAWKQWTGMVKEATGRKGKTLFLPLRLALTGRAHGPEMSHLLPLIGKARALARLVG